MPSEIFVKKCKIAINAVHLLVDKIDDKYLVHELLNVLDQSSVRILMFSHQYKFINTSSYGFDEKCYKLWENIKNEKKLMIIE